jgi:transcriptional regulator with XRE-family HTH domain
MMVRDFDHSTRKLTTVDILTQPFLGSVLAMILFVILKAGVLVALDSRSTNLTTSELNPFFLAFVGVVGGLLSEQVVDRIRTLGERLLANDKKGAKYFKRTKLASDKDPDDLRQRLKADHGVIEAWLSGKSLVPIEGQYAIATWLSIPIDEVFSDEPADQASEKNTNGVNKYFDRRSLTDDEKNKVTSETETLALASRLGLGEKDLREWLAGNIEVPIEGQYAIAAWLNKPMEVLFVNRSTH